MATVFLGIGSNLGDRRANIEKALGLLREDKEISVEAVSDLMETEPVGGPAGQGNYLNGAARIRTELLPLALLSRLKAIERRLGRQKAEPNSPRPMDLDILFYDDVIIVEGKNLHIPHPRMHARGFVLEPLSQIASDWVHPRLQKTVRGLYEDLIREGHRQTAGT
ncbi:MAG: 2-amino-4-hydroxy-6-hydroxymethyldihydropteridine diphosphokinase [Candidatus Omnitrophica bacterium]|nr:2-amino-4-hydroxy-6-hydroxymethyldihydropteridine diphosphokinase [Candidatus Omnitrophota bacterium]